MGIKKKQPVEEKLNVDSDSLIHVDQETEEIPEIESTNPSEKALGVNSKKIKHTQPDDPTKPKSWSYRVRSPKQINNPKRYQIEDTKVLIESGLEPNPVYFDGNGISEYISKDAYTYLLRCTYTPYKEV